MKSKLSRMQSGTLRELGRVAFAMLFAFAAGAVFLMAIGSNPLTIYGAIFAKAFGSFDSTLRRATPLMLSGLAIAIPLQTGMFFLRRRLT